MTKPQSYPVGVSPFAEYFLGRISPDEFNWNFNRLVLRRYLHGMKGWERSLAAMEIIDRSDPFGIVGDVALKASKR